MLALWLYRRRGYGKAALDKNELYAAKKLAKVSKSLHQLAAHLQNILQGNKYRANIIFIRRIIPPHDAT